MYSLGLSLHWWGFTLVCGGFAADLPDLHGPISTTRDVNSRVERVPAHFVDSHVVGVDCVQELAAVGFGTLVDFTFLCPHEKKVVIFSVEVKSCPTPCQNNQNTL